MTKKEIFAGITNDNELYYIEIEPSWKPSSTSEQAAHFSMCGTTLSVIDGERAEQEVREQLEDGELWKQAVEADNTTLGLNDWVDEVLSIDGWEGMHDFDYDISPFEYEGTDYYFEYSGAGQHQVEREDMEHLFITEKQYSDLMHLWDTYHLKPEPTSGKDRAILDELLAIEQDQNAILTKTLELIEC